MPGKRRLTVKHVTYGALFTGISVALTVFLTTYTPILIFPSVRLTFECITIKTVGFIFGPFIGFFSGIIAEFWINLLRPSYLHWTYSLGAGLYGFFLGLGCILRTSKSMTIVKLFILNMVVLLLMLMGFLAFIWFLPSKYMIIFPGSLNWSISKEGIILFISLFFIFYMVFIIGYLIIKRNSNYLKIKTILSLFTVNFLSDYIISVILLPYGDLQTLQIAYSIAFLTRFISCPFRIFFNTFFIYLISNQAQIIIRQCYTNEPTKFFSRLVTR